MDISGDRLEYVIRTVFRSQRAFAHALGVHESTVSKWIKGERAIDETVLDAIEKLGISIGYLLGTEVEKFADNQAGARLRASEVQAIGKMLGVEAPDDSKGSGRSVSELNWQTKVVKRKPSKLSPEIERITVDQQGDGEVVIPMLESSIPAGYKVPIYEDLATAFNVTSYYKNCFTMRVRGDSMVDAGILDGDRVVIKRGHRFRNGDVIAAVVDGEITLKGVWTEDDRIHLVPANEKYPVYVVPEEASFECLGVCIDTFRPPRKVSKR